MSFLQELQHKRMKLQPTTTIVTTPSGECFVGSLTDPSALVRLQERQYGFVVDTKPDAVPACILDDFLYLGSQDAVCNDVINTYRISHVLSVGVETPYVPFSTVQCLFVPCLDVPETQLFSNVMQKAVDFIESVRLCKGRVLVHCNAGVSRAPSVIISYLMKQQSMSFDVAYALVKSKRECIQPNPGFMIQLRSYS